MRAVALFACVAALCVALWRHASPRAAPGPASGPAAPRPAPRPTATANASAEPHRTERRLTDNSLATALSSNYGAGGTSACGYGTSMCTCVAMFMRSLAYTGTIPSELGDCTMLRFLCVGRDLPRATPPLPSARA